MHLFQQLLITEHLLLVTHIRITQLFCVFQNRISPVQENTTCLLCATHILIILCHKYHAIYWVLSIFILCRFGSFNLILISKIWLLNVSSYVRWMSGVALESKTTLLINIHLLEYIYLNRSKELLILWSICTERAGLWLMGDIWF